MALGFIKKVLSFGQKKKEKQKKHARPHKEKIADAPKKAHAKNYKTASKSAPPKQKEALKSKPVQKAAKATGKKTAHSAAVKAKATTAAEKKLKATQKAKPAATSSKQKRTSAPAAADTPKKTPAKNYKTASRPAPSKQKEALKSKPVQKAAKATGKKTAHSAAIKAKATAAAEKKLKATQKAKHQAPKEEKSRQAKADVSVSFPAAGGRPAAARSSYTRSGKVSIGDILEIIEETAHPSKEKTKQELNISWFDRLKSGLSRSSRQLGVSIGGILTKRKLDAETLQDLEDVLIQADLGLETAMRITDTLGSGRFGKNISTDEVHAVMATEIRRVLEPVAKRLELDLIHKPYVILVVGVNGTGKTTTIGKLAAKLTAGGLSVMLAAGDTFRAAAIEQLHIWGKRTGSAVVSSQIGSDAASLAYDAYAKAKAAGSDVLIIDTAGRLQNRTELMDELAKIVRVLNKQAPDAPHTVLQTLDATTGQNALSQVETFRNIAGVNGLVMTKLDGTARGGILVAIAAKHKLPVHFIGVGETVDDLEPFSADEFAEAITGTHKV